MALLLADLPGGLRRALSRLCADLQALLGPDLVSLWAHGATTLPDRPKRPGDVDTHAVLRRQPTLPMATRIDDIHQEIARDAGLEWDSWYILESAARLAQPPRHALDDDKVDGAWGLHRAHWLAGRFVVLHGQAPTDFVIPPTWRELEQGLRVELADIDRVLAGGQNDLYHRAYVVANACRIIYSLDTRDVVVSKRAAARWSLDHLPAGWHPAIEAAVRAYDGEASRDDLPVLDASLLAIVSAARARLA